MPYKKIITHAGRFHTDEVLAIATIFHFYKELKIERSFSIKEKDFVDPSVLILDIGRQYTKEKSNFDHHQDADLPATNMLVLEHFCDDEALRKDLIENLFAYVSAVDVGDIVENRNNQYAYEVPSFSGMIKRMNALENGFEKALDLARVVLETYIISAQKTIEGIEHWKALEFQGAIAIQHDTNEITNWKKQAEKDDILLLISPNNRGGYQIISRNSEELKIPASKEQSFLHNAQFLAVYPSYELALKHAQEIVANAS